MEVIDTEYRSQGNATTNQWYNPGSIQISVPIGVWNMYYKVATNIYTAGAGGILLQVTLSTTSSSESNSIMTAQSYLPDISSGSQFRSTLTAQFVYTIQSKTTNYLNIRRTAGGATSIHFDNNLMPCVIRATCAYL